MENFYTLSEDECLSITAGISLTWDQDLAKYLGNLLGYSFKKYLKFAQKLMEVRTEYESQMGHFHP